MLGVGCKCVRDDHVRHGGDLTANRHPGSEDQRSGADDEVRDRSSDRIGR